jgi:filamentous hemagglutinin
MNKTRYRIVFNKARGCLMAVAETAIAHGRGASGATTSSATLSGQLRLSVLGLVCKWLAGTVLVCLPLAWLAPLQAQTVATRIVADPTAPLAQRPTVLTTSNGLVQVDIRTPSAAGVSRNTYNQFDVGAAGAVLNNSRTPVQTQQGGWVQGNPWLATGSARVILNEVNSSNPSYLQGYIEVAGQRAQVIIANPSGIAINGGGFINADTATMTTGTAIMNAGSLESFRVQGGQIAIDGKGLDARSTDYTAILSRALQVNAGIWAQQLQVVTGTNDIAAPSVSANTVVQSTPLAGTANPPGYALDVAALGGMYARKIHLIGTEAGVGVRNAGLLQASSGPLTLTHQGWLSNSGTVQASGGDVVVQAQGTMVQSGTVYSDRNVQFNSQASQTHSGVVAALGSVQIQAKEAGTGTNTGIATPQILASATTVWAAGMHADGSLETLPMGETSGGQTLRVYADGLLQTAGQALATQDLSLQAASLDVSQSRQQATRILMQATTGDLQAAGSRILAAQTLHMQTAQTLITDRAQLQADALTLQAQALSNVAGQLSQTGQGDQSLTLQGELNNTAGTIYSAARHLSILAQNIDNTAGQILHTGQGTLDIGSSGDLINTLQSNTQPAVPDGGRISGAGNVQVRANNLKNTGGIYADQNLHIDAAYLDNQASGQILSVQTTALQISNTLTNRGLIDGADTHIQGATVNNIGTGRIYGDRVAIAANALTNQEEIVDAITRAAVIAGRERVDMGVQSLNNRENALIFSGGDMALGGSLNTSWRAIGSAQSIHNSSATIEAAQALTIQAANIRNTNEHFASQVQRISQTSITEYQHAPGDVISASDNSTRFSSAQTSITNCESLCMTTVAGTSDAFVRYIYTRTVDASVVTQTAPGQILAGQGITMTADTVLNDKSQIVAGGSLSVQATLLENLQGEGTQITTDDGTATSFWRIRKKGTDTYGSSSGAYASVSTQTIGLKAARYEQFAASSSTSTAPVDSTLPVLQAQVRTQTWRATVPNTSLYRQHPEAGAKYLVESDPRFTQYKTWLGSDYMTAQLQFDPATSQKRMGDGFYEQKLVREQVQALTGQRFLGDYSNDQTQYMALMNNGLTYAKALQLRPGIALSAEQVAQLTSDMVWLVTQEVTLADGSRQSVLVPQVYVRVQPGDVDGTGALLAGRDVQLNLSADATNSGTIAGRNLVQINAANIQNMGGQMSADTLALTATQDIDNIGGQIQAQSAALLSAGRDINLRTTTQSSTNKVGNNSFAQTGIDRVAGLYVSGPAGVLIASAGRDLNLTAAQIGNIGTGATALSAGNNINLSTVTTANSQDINWSGANYLRQSASQDVGSQIIAAGKLTFNAGQDLNAKAATLNAGQALNVTTGRNVNITTGQSSQSLDTANTITSKGMLSSRTLRTRETSQSTTAIGSSLEGQSVSINAGKDLTVQGSSVLADQNVNLNAGCNISITAAQNTQSQTDYRQETKSGLMSSGGIGFTIGKQQQSLDQQGQSTTAAQSTIGAINGNVTITAGQTFTQTGSDLLTPKGDVSITAKAVNITEARETGSQSTEQKFKQSGLTVAITSPVISALQTASSQLQAAGNTQSSRMQLLAGANAAMNLKQGADAIKAGQGDESGMVKGADGKMVEGNAADKAGGIGISISVGSSSSQSKQSSSADNARGSSVTAGGNISIQATGDGQGSNLTVQGSSIEAAGTTRLQADNQVNLLAAQNTTTESSSNQSKSASVGVAMQLGNGGGMGVTASASKATGQGAGNGVTFTNTQVAGSAVSIGSGGDTTLKGAVVKANQVTTNVDGNLTIQSLQDQSQYKESSKSAGGSILVGAGVSGSVNLGQSKINSTYTSVNEQSAIRAGDGGFQVEVKGNTTLTGGQITSTQKAVDAGKNSFSSAGGVQTQDLQNSASYEAKSVSVGLGAGALPGKSASAGLSGAGFGSDKNSAQSTSTAGISGVAGNTAARTGDKSTSIAPIFDADKVKKEIEAQVIITQEFGKQAGKAITDYTNGQRKALQEQAKNASTPEDKANAEQAIKDVNMQERALNILTGALTGMVGSVITKEALSTAAEKMRDLMIEDSKKFAGVVDSTGKPLFSNQSGESAGVNGTGFKLGGTRADLDLLCGTDGNRCSFEKNPDGSIDKSKPVTFLGQENADKSRQSYADFLKTEEGQKMLSAPFGGLQGGERTLFGQTYDKGSWQDKLIEAFAGPHDLIGGKLSGLYDAQGNIKQGMSSNEIKAYDRWSAAALLPAAPFAASQVLSPEIWKAIGILLKAGR